MEFLAGLYTLLLVTICLLLAVVLWKLNKPRNGGDDEELKCWMQQQLTVCGICLLPHTVRQVWSAFHRKPTNGIWLWLAHTVHRKATT